MAINPLKELFLGNLLKEVKLKTFGDKIKDLDFDIMDNERKNQELIDAYYEDKLKQLYLKYIQSVEHFTHDPELKTKKIAIQVLYELLINNCEQEQFLLEKLVNKLGDLDSKNATNVVHLLERLVNEHHPAMKEIIIKEVERILYRPNITYTAQYNALSLLSMILFLKSEHKAANLVMNIYLTFFKSCLKKEEVNNRMMAVLLTGISRAFPFSNLENNYLEEKIDTIYKLIHHVNFNISIQAYNLIFKMITKENSDFLSDRYCISIYKSLFNPSIDECAKKATYLNVLYKTIKNDCLLKRNLAFIRRILQISLHNPSNLVSALLILISSLVKDKKELFTEFNTKFLGKVNDLFDNEDDEDEEHFRDDDKEDPNEDTSENDSKSTLDLNEQKQSKSSWVFKKVNLANQVNSVYEPLHRNPLYSNADISVPYELLTLRNHYHPTICLFTEKLMNKEAIDYDGDALYDFNTKSFLDKFVYKNPKKISKQQNNQAREKSRFEREINYRKNKLLINTPSYISENENKIPIEERFIYTFLKNKTKYENNIEEDITDADFEQFVLNKFEANFDHDLKTSITNSKKQKRDEEELSSEEEIDIDFEQDNEYDEKFKEFESVIGLKNKYKDDSEEENSDKEAEVDDSKFKRKGRDKNLMGLLASADEFAHLLQENEDDQDDIKFAGDLSDIDSEDDDESELDFDDDEEIIEKRKSRSIKRKAKEIKDSQILQKKRNRSKKMSNKKFKR